MILLLSGIAWFSIAYLTGSDLSRLSEFLKPIPMVVTIDVVAIVVFVKWLWRWKWLHRRLGPFGPLLPSPDLNGTWLGEIRSDWVDERTGEKIPPIPGMLTVRQSFFHISCVMQTEEMRSDSYAEGFLIDDERQIRQLAYSYQSRPRSSVRKRSTPHDGTTVFDVIESFDRKLKGRYWTERKTTGEMKFRFHSRVILEELPSDIENHPMA